MYSRWLSSLAVLGLLAVPVLAQPKEGPGKAAVPTVVIQLGPIQDLLADAKYLAGFTEFEETAKQFAGAIEAQAGAKGIRGIDPKKPIGVYAYLKKDLLQSEAVVMVPIADEATFLKSLEDFNL